MLNSTIVVTLEYSDNELWGNISSDDAFSYTTVGSNKSEVENSLRELLIDFLAHEGKENPNWKDVKIEDVEFTFQYDLASFFEVFKQLKISSIAEMAGMNPSLVRQYAKGITFASERQVAKIQSAIRTLANDLAKVEFL